LELAHGILRVGGEEIESGGGNSPWGFPFNLISARLRGAWGSFHPAQN